MDQSHPPHTPESLNQETARIRWAELERHFARGVVIRVARELDLVAVAVAFANDDRAAVEAWLEGGALNHLDTDTARDWRERDPELWAVVTAPWVLVQEPALKP
ncbi:DUF2288 domain-containing protein [Thiohalobacter thiocyanaticus]|uniref:DUF2288 domain-containing protein n=1 Tax=Thiohalobacter thiocyanaticus TaxID=585455 RepID=A0A426QJ74_9GAMM|nr:DUF2288 domain-containing protein [Thiohalobacter thiocyanaticus]RRQ21790.1 DUF2288 domain-containing protein [Thiohalobacter thiocyanaticus]